MELGQVMDLHIMPLGYAESGDGARCARPR